MSLIPLFILGAVGVAAALATSSSSSGGGGGGGVPGNAQQARAAGYARGVEAANNCRPKKTEAELRASAGKPLSEEMLLAAIAGYNEGYDTTYKANLASGKCKAVGPVGPVGPGTKSVCMTDDVAKVVTLKEIQQKLMTLGYSVGAGKDDGNCGNDTKAAISKFQADNKPLSVTGIVDAPTIAVLKSKVMPVVNTDEYTSGQIAGRSDGAATIVQVEFNGGSAPAVYPNFNSSWSDDGKNGYHDGFNEVLAGTSPGYTIEGDPEFGAIVTRNSAGGVSPIDETAQSYAAETAGSEDGEASVQASKYAGGAAVAARHDGYHEDWSASVKAVYWNAFGVRVANAGFIYDPSSDMVASAGGSGVTGGGGDTGGGDTGGGDTGDGGWVDVVDTSEGDTGDTGGGEDKRNDGMTNTEDDTNWYDDLLSGYS